MAHPMQHYGERKLKKKFPMHEGAQRMDEMRRDEIRRRELAQDLHMKDLVDNLYDWLYIILNRLDQIENPGMEERWPESELVLDQERMSMDYGEPQGTDGTSYATMASEPMSEPTLYERGKPQFEWHWDWLDELVRAGVLVERKRHEVGCTLGSNHLGDCCVNPSEGRP